MTELVRNKWIERMKALAREAENDNALAIASILCGMVASMLTGNEMDLASHHCQFTAKHLMVIRQSLAAERGTIQ